MNQQGCKPEEQRIRYTMAFCDSILFYLHWGWVILTFRGTLTVTKTKWLKLKNTTRYNDHRIQRLIQKYMGISFKLWWKILPKTILEEDRQETLGIIHHISILESNHTASLKMGGTARTYHSCAKGQTWEKVWKICRRIATIEQKDYAEKDIRKEKGESNWWTDSQELIAPKINETLIGYKIDMFSSILILMDLS